MQVIPIIQLGIGNVGREVIRKVLEYNKTKRPCSIRHIGIANSTNFIFQPDGIKTGSLKEIACRGFSPVLYPDLQPHSGNPDPFIEVIQRGKMENICVVDVTASENILVFLRGCAKGGFKLVLANKKPLTGTMTDFNLMAQAGLGCRATVGAGLPVIPAVRRILSDNNKIEKAEGCFSGTMGILCSAMEDGASFSTIVREAHHKGYTEPDPRDDLSGMDAARKILIIARLCGYDINLDEVFVESMYPEQVQTLPLEEFMKTLEHLDNGFKTRFNQARRNNTVLRFIASLQNGKCCAGLKEVPFDSEIGRLKGAEKVVILHTDKRKEEPIVIHGKGAGAGSAARDVLEDILEISDCK